MDLTQIEPCLEFEYMCEGSEDFCPLQPGDIKILNQILRTEDCYRTWYATYSLE